jgi:hypothetical protein
MQRVARMERSAIRDGRAAGYFVPGFRCAPSGLRLASAGWAKARNAVPTLSFSEASGQFGRVSCPVARQYALRHIAVETAEWPVVDASHQPVLHRIVMDVIDVPFEIDVVADGVLPIAALPQRIFAALVFRSAAAALRNKATEQTFTTLLTPRIIGVVGRKGRDDVQMLGKHDDSVDRKRPLVAGHVECLSQQVDTFNQRPGLTIGKGRREEESAAGAQNFADNGPSGLRLSLFP